MEVIELLASGQRTKPIVHPCLPLSKTGNCLKVQNIGEKVFCCCLSLLFIKDRKITSQCFKKKVLKIIHVRLTCIIFLTFFLKP